MITRTEFTTTMTHGINANEYTKRTGLSLFALLDISTTPLGVQETPSVRVSQMTLFTLF